MPRIKEELSKILNEGASARGNIKTKYDISPQVQSMPGGRTDMYKTPYLVIWLNGGSSVYVPLKGSEEPEPAVLQKIANYLASEFDKAIDNIPKKFKV